MAETIYIVDPLPDECRRIVNALAEEPVLVKSYDDAAQFLDEVAATASGCVLAPPDLPGVGLRGLIDEINRRQLPLAVVVIGRDSEFATAVELCAPALSTFSSTRFPMGGCDQSYVGRSAPALD